MGSQASSSSLGVSAGGGPGAGTGTGGGTGGNGGVSAEKGQFRPEVLASLLSTTDRIVQVTPPVSCD